MTAFLASVAARHSTMVKALFETFFFNFDDDLYGEELSVQLFSWLRAEEKFVGIEPLIAQMNIDKRDAEQFLSTLSPDHLKWPIVDHG